jgi:hypothetical protein
MCVQTCGGDGVACDFVWNNITLDVMMLTMLRFINQYIIDAVIIINWDLLALAI